MAERFTSLENLAEDIQKITNEYRDKVLGAIAEGVQEGAEIFVNEAEKASPVDTGEYQKSWVIKPMARAKFVRYIGNTKKVKAHYKDAAPSIPLINILEYTKRVNKNGRPMARPVVATAISNSKDQIINAIVSKIQKESK